VGWIVVGHVADIGEARDLGRGVDPCAPGERRRGSPPRHGSAPFDDEIDQRFDVAIRVVEKMGGVGEAAQLRGRFDLDVLRGPATKSTRLTFEADVV